LTDLAAPRISLVGTAGLLFQAPGAFALPVQARIWHMADTASRWPGVAEAVPGVTSLMLVFATPPASPEPMTQKLLAAWDDSNDAPVPEGRLVEVPVSYGGPHGPDLAGVAAHTGFDVAEVVRRHGAAEYRVFALGSQPGFAYLGGLDPGIGVPRKAVPVLRVEAGTVVIGGMQAGVVAAAGPNGWHAIGHSESKLFDPVRSSPTLFLPGDRVRFRKIALEA
jgi:KipI family sensor histidine kinase inhibitor